MSSPDSKRSRILEGTLRPGLLEEEVVNCIKSSWTDSTTDSTKLRNSGVEIIYNPFPVCIIENFIHSPELLKSATGELKDVTFFQKSNDLYQFKQSDDVRNLKNFTFIPQLYDVIRNEGLNWINKILGSTQLKPDISATFSSYKYQDRLLCHDDKCGDRHIAFILYLVDNWEAEDGGALQLFNTDSNGYPHEVVKSILPRFNSLVFFEVTHTSFHQVAEVLSKSKERISLNGWFHSSGKKLSKNNCKVLETQQSLGSLDEYNLQEYFLFTYFDYMNKRDIKAMFSNDSEIQLEEFMVPNFWEEVINGLKSPHVRWVVKGPPNIRRYEVAETSSLPPSLKTLKGIFESKCMFKYLKAITGLDFVPAESSDPMVWEIGVLPHCHFELQRWTHTSYTLIHDQDPEFHAKTLDVIMRIPYQRGKNIRPTHNEDEPAPGHIIYIDSESDDEECLLHIGYKMNSLALIFRDTKTLRFTKYLDSTAEPFYQLFCTYRPWRPPPDQPNLKHCEADSDSEGSAIDLENLVEYNISQEEMPPSWQL